MEGPLKNSKFVNVIAGIGLFSGLMGLVFSFNTVMGPYAFVIALPAVVVCGLALYFDFQEKTRSAFAIAAMGMSIICVAVSLYQHSIMADQSKIKEQAEIEEKEAQSPESERNATKTEIRLPGTEQKTLGFEHFTAIKPPLENGGSPVSAGTGNQSADDETLLEYDRQLTRLKTELATEKAALEEIQAHGITQENYEAFKNRVTAYNHKLAQFADMFGILSKMLNNTQADPRLSNNAGSTAAGTQPNIPMQGASGFTGAPVASAPLSGGCAATPARQGAPTGCAAGSMGLN